MNRNWYPIALVVLAIPQCWLGGKLYEMGWGRPKDAASGAAPAR